jgi:peptidoglycan/xylan/chitin deacetylase (PgdA/CDA1 family)
MIGTTLAAVAAVGAVVFLVAPDNGTPNPAVAAAPAGHQRPPADREDPNAWPPQHGTVPNSGPLPVLPLADPPAAPLALDESGPEAPMIYRIPTDKKIVFLTMDDGTTQTPVATKLYQETRLPVTIFLISHTGARNPKYFKKLTTLGGVIQDHTLTHPKLNGRPAAFQHNQLCRSANQLKDLFGTRPTLFRPPYGLYDHTTLKIAHQCGYHAVVMWEASMIGGHMYISNHGTGPKNALVP